MFSKRRLLPPLLCALVLASTGCSSSPYFTPREVSQITFTYRSSPSVIVERAWIQRENDQMSLVGYVSAGARDMTTERTRLEILFQDASGATVERRESEFRPAKIPKPVQMHGGVSWFKVPLPPWTADIRQVIVSAKDS